MNYNTHLNIPIVNHIVLGSGADGNIHVACIYLLCADIGIIPISLIAGA